MIGSSFTTVLCVGLLWTVSADCGEVQRIEGDKAKKLTGALTEATGKLTDLPIKLALDGDRGVGLHGNNAAVFVVPDAKLTADLLKKLDKQVVPLGVLYLHKVTPVVAEQAVAADQHRTVEITVENEKATVKVLPLAVARVEGRLVLLVYTTGKTPALVAELVDAVDQKDVPLDLEVRPLGNSRGAIVMNVLGRYRAAIQVAGQE